MKSQAVEVLHEAARALIVIFFEDTNLRANVGYVFDSSFNSFHPLFACGVSVRCGRAGKQ